MNQLATWTGATLITVWVGLSAHAQVPVVSPAAVPFEPVVGQLEHSGYGLVGSGGRHYIFGGLAMADYAHGGQHYFVTLQLQEPTMLPKPDEDFLYYRELGSGHRWAIGRHPLKDDSYAVYFQPAGTSGSGAKWMLFHRARLIWPNAVAGSTEGRPQIPQMTQTIRNCVIAP